MKKILYVLILLPVAFSAEAADIQASWDPVTVDEQGAPENISHYMLYWGPMSRPGSVTRPGDPAFSYAQSQNVGNTTSSQQSGFTPGQTYYFAVAAVDYSGNTSAYSAEVTVNIPSDQDGGVDAGTDAGGQDAGADQAASDPGGDEEVVIEGGCGCGVLCRPGSSQGSTGSDIGLLALLALPFLRRKREQY